MFHVRFENLDFLCSLIDLHRYKFEQINDHFTLQAYGKFAKKWKEDWMIKNPDSTEGTEMAVYYYKKGS